MMEGCRVLLVQVICALVVVDLATAELELDVEYPDMSNRGRVTLTCRDGLPPLAGAVFLKDGVNLTQGPASNQVTSLTNEGVGVVTITFTQAQEGVFRCVDRLDDDRISPEMIGLAAPPATNYENESRLRYVVFPTLNSSRVIELSCPIRPGALEESYSVEWQTSNAGGGSGFTTLENSAHYDFSDDITPSSQPVYRCRVSIQHRNDQEDTIPYNGPKTMIKKKVLATIDSDIQNVNITQEENTSFTCNFSKGDVNSTVYWTVDGGQYDCVDAEDIGADSNGCYTTETQSVLLIRDTSSFTPGNHSVQCILQQNIPQEFRGDESFRTEFNEILTRTASLTITSTGGTTVPTTTPTPTPTVSPRPPTSSSIALAAGAAGGAVAVIFASLVVVVVFVLCCCGCIGSNTDPEGKRTRCFKWNVHRDVENGDIPIIQMPPPTGPGHVSPSKLFHARDTPEYRRQNATQNGSRKNSLDLPEEPFYNGGSMISATSGISALSDEDEAMSCPPSPAVSDYPGREEGDKIQHGPSISVDDSELFSYNDQQYDGRGPRDYHPSDQDPHYHLEEELYHSHKYAPSQASSFGMHNLFEGHSHDGYAETGYGSQPEFHYHHASCDPQCSLGVPHYDNRTGSASSVRSDRTHSTRVSKGSSRSGKSSRSGRSCKSERLEVEHDHRYSASPHYPHDERHRRHSPSSRHSERHSDHDHHRSRSGSPHSRSPRGTAERPSYMREASQLSGNGPHYHSHYVLPDPQPSAVPMRPTRSAEWTKPSYIPLHHNEVDNRPPPPDRTHLSNEPDGSEIGDMMLMAIGCLMHQENCQIPKCPCKEVKERFQHLMPQTRAHRQKEAERVVDEAQRGDLDPTDRRQQLRISLSSQNFNKDIHAHYHMTSRSHIRSSDGRKTIIQRRRSRSMDLTPVAEQPEPCALSPNVVLSDGARGLLCGPTVFSPAVTPSGEKLRVLSPAAPSANTIAPPVLLREISLSADNLPALCLNDCPIAATPLMQLGNRTLGSAMQSPLVTNQRRWSAGSAEGQRQPVVKEKTGHQKDSPSSDEGHTTEHERYTSQDSSSSLQTTSTHSSGQSGKSEGTSVLGESGQRTHVFDAQTSTSTTSTDMDDTMRRRQFQLWGKQNEITKNPDETMRLDSGYGTSGDMTDVEGSINKPHVPPDNLPLTPQKVPTKQKYVVPVDQPKHLAPSNRRGSTSSHGSHTSHLSVGSHVSQGSDGSITTQTLC